MCVCACVCEWDAALEDGNAVGEVYLDDGKSYHYQKGAFARRALVFSAFSTLECSVPSAASAAAGGVEGAAAAATAATGKAVAGVGGAFPAAAATVERVIILGDQRYKSATVKGSAVQVEQAPASTREGVAAAATAVRKPDVPIAGDWTITLA